MYDVTMTTYLVSVTWPLDEKTEPRPSQKPNKLITGLLENNEAVTITRMGRCFRWTKQLTPVEVLEQLIAKYPEQYHYQKRDTLRVAIKALNANGHN